MSYGLLIKDHNNNTIIGPDTFTVRMVDSILSGVGMMRPGQGVYLPVSNKVKAGMFAIVMPLKQYSRGYVAPYSTFSANPLPVCIPYAEVGDGHVVLSADRTSNSRTDGNVAIYIFTSV